MIIRGGRVFDGRDGFVGRDLYVDGDRISGGDRGGEVVDAAGCYVIPGLIDIHIHGCVGREFVECPSRDMSLMTRYEASRGVTAICPTTLTLSEDVLARACGEIASASDPEGAEIVGINLEGPFISPNKLGAQNPGYVRPPDAALFRRLKSASGGMVKMLAVAPEVEGAFAMIDELKDEVVCSVAHTAADYETAARAFSLGARHVTHLYNAMPPFHHRSPGVIGAALDAPGCMAELICDGVHIHPSVVRATFGMFGAGRIVMVSDSMMATGLGDGVYQLGGLPVRVSGNVAVLEDGGNIAGSVTNLMDCLRTAVRDMGIPLHYAVKCASVNPARAIGIFSERGDLSAGKIADAVLLDDDLNIAAVIIRGKGLKLNL
jgi:N-acetylglucosamine-6-phosphate deacetylase